MTKIDVIAIDKALTNCFIAQGMPRADYVIVVTDMGKDASAIGTNIGPKLAECMLATALHLLTSRGPDETVVLDDGIGSTVGHA